jgi:hypothetical protein
MFQGANSVNRKWRTPHPQKNKQRRRKQNKVIKQGFSISSTLNTPSKYIEHEEATNNIPSQQWQSKSFLNEKANY